MTGEDILYKCMDRVREIGYADEMNPQILIDWLQQYIEDDFGPQFMKNESFLIGVMAGTIMLEEKWADELHEELP